MQFIHLHRHDGAHVKGPNDEIRHVVVTPVRDEEEYIADCVSSMINQTIKPKLWIIIDDNSQDGSPGILSILEEDNDWIKVIRPDILGTRERGRRIAKLVNRGIEEIDVEWDFLSKIDADMILTDDYFERLFSEFILNSKLGISSGNCIVMRGSSEVLEKVSEHHTRGGLKTYRAECYFEIGGIMEINGWDGMDNILARLNGWETKNWPDITAIHQRETGSYFGKVKGNYESGKIAYYLCYYMPYLFGRIMMKCFERPYLIGSMAFLFGFIGETIRFKPRFTDREAIKFQRRMQRDIILRRIGLLR